MKKIKINELSYKIFSGYGEFKNVFEPEGFKIGEEPSEFFRDIIGLKVGFECSVSFSIFRGTWQVGKPILSLIEYHSKCEEAMLPLDGDYVICLAKATPPGVIPINEIEAFRIPKGTIVVLKPGVWHSGPFLYKCDSIRILVALPERTYANDSVVYNIPEREKIEIEWDFQE